MKRKKKSSTSRLSRRFRDAMEEDAPVQRDARYWLIHALHWHALLVAAIAVLMIGYVIL